MLNDNGKETTVLTKFWPIFIVATLSVVFDDIQMLADEVIVGNLFDDVAFGAINLVEPYKMLNYFVTYLICIGGAGMIVRSKGAKDPAEMQRIFNHCVTSCLVAGVIFFTVYTIFSEQLVSMVAGDAPAYPYSLKVFYWDRFIDLINPLFAFFYSYVMYIGNKWVTFISMTIQLVLNILLSIYLGKAMGIGGVALATVIAQVISVLVLCIYVIAKMNGLKYRPYLKKSYLKMLVPLGFPESSLIFAVTIILEFGVNALALNLYSTQGVAVVALIINLFTIVAYVSEGISEYEIVAVNMAIGSKNREELRYVVSKVFRAVLIESIVFIVLFIFIAPQIVEFFDIDDPETAKIATWSVRVFAIAPIAIIAARVTAIFHQYTGRIGKAVLIFVLATGVMPLAMAACLAPISLETLVLGIAVGPVVAMLLIWFLPIRRKQKADIDLRRMTVVFKDELEEHSEAPSGYSLDNTAGIQTKS